MVRDPFGSHDKRRLLPTLMCQLNCLRYFSSTRTKYTLCHPPLRPPRRRKRRRISYQSHSRRIHWASEVRRFDIGEGLLEDRLRAELLKGHRGDCRISRGIWGMEVNVLLPRLPIRGFLPADVGLRVGGGLPDWFRGSSSTPPVAIPSFGAFVLL